MIDKKEKLKRLKQRLHQCYMDLSIIEYNNTDIVIFNLLSVDLKEEK